MMPKMLHIIQFYWALTTVVSATGITIVVIMIATIITITLAMEMIVIIAVMTTITVIAGKARRPHAKRGSLRGPDILLGSGCPEDQKTYYRQLFHSHFRQVPARNHSGIWSW